MVLVGLGFFVDWLLLAVFLVGAEKAALITAILFIILGILLGERPWEKRP